MRIPRYDMPSSPRFKLGNHTVHALKIVDFLRYVIERDKLSIDEYLEAMGQDPFFLVAATGLGKTVAVPIHVFIRLMQAIGTTASPEPRVWVIEPRIPIAVDQMKFMNSLWDEYLQKKGERKLPPLFGCITSASGQVNRNAPIKFVTTGIFELMAKAGELTPERDRVIIDEAHVTVEQNPGVELGLALARKAGVTVDYMSATVDTTTLADDLGIQTIIRADKQRYEIWKHNLLHSLAESLPALIENTLMHPDASSAYFPQPGEYPNAKAVVDAVLEPNRSHGMLAVVNSFAGDQSDVALLTEIIREQFPELPVLELASEVVRDARREQEFQQRLQAIEAAKQNYVILATSVVEMGITFPTLDYVVTMDSGYDQETIGDVSFPVIAPLGVNSLLQRMGRVGRRRPGIAYISHEVGAEYATLEDRELNRGALAYEPIRFPLISAPLMPLAYYVCGQEWNELDTWVASLALPSRLHEDTGRMEYLNEQIDTLEALGIAADSRLTEFGTRMEAWIGRADLAYATQLQKRLEEGAFPPEIIFWVVVTALSNTPLSTLRTQHDFFVDYDGEHSALPHSVEIWTERSHEDLAAFGLVSLLGGMFASLFWNPRQNDENDSFQLERWCNLAGVSGRKMRPVSKAILETWKVFVKINGDTDRFKASFGNHKTFHPASVPWRNVVADQYGHGIRQQLCGLSGNTTVAFTYNEQLRAFDWVDTVHGHAGVMSQDDTPVRLVSGATYVARVMPGRRSKDDPTAWRLAHLGEIAN